MGEESTKSANMSKEEEDEELSSDIASALMVRNLWLFKNDGLNFRLLLFEKVVLIPLFIFIALFDDDDDDKDDDVLVVVDIIIIVIVFSLLLLLFFFFSFFFLKCVREGAWFKLTLCSKKCFRVSVFFIQRRRKERKEKKTQSNRTQSVIKYNKNESKARDQRGRKKRIIVLARDTIDHGAVKEAS